MRDDLRATEIALLRDLADRDAIRDVLARYCYAIDRRDPEVLQSLFWPDSRVEFGMSSSTGPEFVKFILEWMKAMAMETTSHMLGSSLIRLDGNKALVQFYIQGFHRLPDANGMQRDVFLSGRYNDAFAFRAGEWRIAHRRLYVDWFREFHDTGDWQTGVFGIKSGSANIGHCAESPWEELRSLLMQPKPMLLDRGHESVPVP